MVERGSAGGERERCSAGPSLFVPLSTRSTFGSLVPIAFSREPTSAPTSDHQEARSGKSRRDSRALAGAGGREDARRDEGSRALVARAAHAPPSSPPRAAEMEPCKGPEKHLTTLLTPPAARPRPRPPRPPPPPLLAEDPPPPPPQHPQPSGCQRLGRARPPGRPRHPPLRHPHHQSSSS